MFPIDRKTTTTTDDTDVGPRHVAATSSEPLFSWPIPQTLAGSKGKSTRDSNGTLNCAHHEQKHAKTYGVYICVQFLAMFPWLLYLGPEVSPASSDRLRFMAAMALSVELSGRSIS